MFEPRDDLCLAHHPLAQTVRDISRVENFYGDVTIEFAIFGQVDSAHTAAPELFHERVLGADNVKQVVQLVV
jgi:hypothetical protein